MWRRAMLRNRRHDLAVTKTRVSGCRHPALGNFRTLRSGVRSFVSARNLSTDMSCADRRPENHGEQHLADEPAEGDVYPRAPAVERIDLGGERAHRRQTPTVAVREAAQDGTRARAERRGVLDRLQDLERPEERGPERVGGEGAEREELEARVEEEGEEVARERAGEGEEERGGYFVSVLRWEAEVGGVGGGVCEDAERGEGVADWLGWWRKSGDARDDQGREVGAEGYR